MRTHAISVFVADYKRELQKQEGRSRIGFLFDTWTLFIIGCMVSFVLNRPAYYTMEFIEEISNHYATDY